MNNEINYKLMYLAISVRRREQKFRNVWAKTQMSSDERKI